MTVAAALLNLNRRRKRLLLLAADALILVLCFLLAMVLRLEVVRFDPAAWAALALSMPLTLWAFARMGLYRSILRFLSGHALGAIAAGAGVSGAALLAVSWGAGFPVPRSVPGIYALLVLCAVAGLRYGARAVLRQTGGSVPRRVAIYGAGEAGRQLHHALSQGRDHAPVVFLDDDPALEGALIGGLRVYPAARAARVIAGERITEILLAMPAIDRARRRRIVAQLEPLGLPIRTIPHLGDIIAGRAGLSDLRPVRPEDLLGRDPVPALPHLMSRNIAGKVVLVTGAGGSIGGELCRHILRQGPERLILLDASELALYTITHELRACAPDPSRIEPILGSVQNRVRMRALLRAFGVQTIYHAAAYKHVSLVEENVIEGITNNIFGTQTLAGLAAEQGVESFILISTDKAVRPTNVMGASKRMAELICQAMARGPGATVFSMVRFGNVLGSSGSVIPRFTAQIDAGGPVTVTHPEVTRYFMTIAEAAQLVIQAGAMAKGGDVFVLDMGEPVKILDLAKTMIRLKGHEPYLRAAAGPARGSIAIEITGLARGEKLFEELLIGNAPRATAHRRIQTATETALPMAELEGLLARLQGACLGQDLAAIRAIFLDAPLQYRPTEAELRDLALPPCGDHHAPQTTQTAT